MSIVIEDRWQQRRGTAADLAAVNEVPLEGERIFEIDTGKAKDGDGVTHYNDLEYENPDANVAAQWGYACSDEVTTLTTGVKLTARAPAAMSLSKVKASLTTASSSGTVTIDIKVNGASIFSTALTIDATEKTSVTAATLAVLTMTPLAIADDDEIAISVTDAGTGATGLKVYMVGTQ